MFIFVELGSEKVLGLLRASIERKPSLVIGVCNPIPVDARRNQPFHYQISGFIRRTEKVIDVLRSPVLSIERRDWIRPMTNCSAGVEDMVVSAV
jgi:hypothetical protein